MQEVLLWNKENNINVNNAAMRKRSFKVEVKDRPATPQFEATFNPYPPKNGFSIPIIPRKASNALATLSACEDIKQNLIKAQKQKPVIARSHKLRHFFDQKSARYSEQQPRNFRGGSLNALSIRHDTIEDRTQQETCPRMQKFLSLYMKQRLAYERILKKHGIQAKIQDDFFKAMI